MVNTSVANDIVEVRAFSSTQDVLSKRSVSINFDVSKSDIVSTIKQQRLEVMTLRKIVNPSDQTQAFLPQFIGENYQTFVNFMAKAAESQERQVSVKTCCRTFNDIGTSAPMLRV